MMAVDPVAPTSAKTVPETAAEAAAVDGKVIVVVMMMMIKMMNMMNIIKDSPSILFVLT